MDRKKLILLREDFNKKKSKKIDIITIDPRDKNGYWSHMCSCHCQELSKISQYLHWYQKLWWTNETNITDVFSYDCIFIIHQKNLSIFIFHIHQSDSSLKDSVVVSFIRNGDKGSRSQRTFQSSFVTTNIALMFYTFMNGIFMIL